jgi:AraC family transcriptional regulator of adaptative response / DNA-3-methyladenine glycosylase II
VDAHGRPLGLDGEHQVTPLFPTADVLAEIQPESIAMPRARGRALIAAATAIAAGGVVLDRSADRAETRAALMQLPGIGDWTADYIAFRVLGDPDVFLPGDLGVKHAADALGIDDLAGRSESWRPWRSYALIHLWTSLSEHLTKES